MAILRLFARRSLPPAASHPCPLCRGDYARQARDLFAAGYYLAAVATARADLESRVMAIGEEHRNAAGKNYKLGGSVGARATKLHHFGVLTRRELQRVEKLTRRAGRMLHRGREVNCLRARWVVVEAERLVATLHANAAMLPQGGAAW